jgi:hypothetical protein
VCNIADLYVKYNSCIFIQIKAAQIVRAAQMVDFKKRRAEAQAAAAAGGSLGGLKIKAKPAKRRKIAEMKSLDEEMELGEDEEENAADEKEKAKAPEAAESNNEVQSLGGIAEQ